MTMTMFTRNNKAPEPVPGPNSAPAAPAPAAPTPVSRPSGTSPSPSVSVISKKLKITGQLESTEDIHIEGEVEGDVRGVSVKVGQHAKVTGTIYGDHVELSGVLEGKIEARSVTLTSTARMNGDIVHQDIRIELGARFDGWCRPERGQANGKVQAAQKAAAASGETRTDLTSNKPVGMRSVA